jgi:hypothetical protein
MTSVSVPIAADWTDIVYWENSFLACGNDGAMMRSANGMVWTPMERRDRTDWTCADYRDGLFVVAGEGGRLCLTSAEGPTTNLVVPDAGDIVDVLFLSRRQLIGLDAAGRFFISDDAGIQWIESDLNTGREPRRMAATVQDRVLIAGADGSLGISQLVNEIVLDRSWKGLSSPEILCFSNTSRSSRRHRFCSPGQKRYRSPGPHRYPDR